MSRNSPSSSSISTQDIPKQLNKSRHVSVSNAKLKLNHPVIQKIYRASIVKARESLHKQKENSEEHLKTLVSVERLYVQNLVGFHKKKISISKLLIPEYQKTPNTSTAKNIKRKKKTSISNFSNCRKSSLQRKVGLGVCSPMGENVNKILF